MPRARDLKSPSPARRVDVVDLRGLSAALAVERRELVAAACELVKRHEGGDWQLSPHFTFVQLSGRSRPPPPRERLSLAQQIEAKLIKRCLGTSPVYFRDAAGAPVAIIATLEKWKPDDMSAGVLGMKYGLTASSTPPWGHAAKVRRVIYRKQ